jgi:hypothetical protein
MTKQFTYVKINGTTIQNTIIDVTFENGLYIVEYWNNRPLAKNQIVVWANEVTELICKGEIITRDLSPMAYCER